MAKKAIWQRDLLPSEGHWLIPFFLKKYRILHLILTNLGKYVDKYLKGVDGVPVEHRVRILRLIENIALGTGAVCYLTESMHGAGSPQAQKILIGRTANIERMKDAAKRLCGITD